MSSSHSIAAPVNELARGEKMDSAQKLKLEKAVREFESVFVGYLLKSMRNTIEKADNSNDGFGSDLLAGMFDVELAHHVSKSSNLGLAHMLYEKLTGEDLPTAARVSAPASVRGNEATQSRHQTAPIVSMRTAASESGKGCAPVPNRLRPEPLASLLPRAAVKDAVEVARAGGMIARKSGSSSLAARLDGYREYIAEAAEKHGVSESLIKAVIATESQARVNAKSPKNAKGLMQLIDSTAAEMGVKNVWDPRQNILGGAKYLAQLLDRFEGDEKLALAGYNAGPANVVKHGGVPPFKETKQYVARVMNFLRMFEQGGDEHE